MGVYNRKGGDRNRIFPLDYYLDEFTFRFNRRRSRARGLLFYRLLQNAVQVDPVPYRRLVGGSSRSDPNM